LKYVRSFNKQEEKIMKKNACYLPCQKKEEKRPMLFTLWAFSMGVSLLFSSFNCL
jgi:hypothetical protein